MSGARVNNYSPSTDVLNGPMESVDDSMIGALALSLTNYTSTLRPTISALSFVEISGSLFKFSTENIISTTGVASTAACDYYINLVPSSSECSAQFSTVVPTWRTDYQGYYENSTSVNRVVGEMYFNGVDYIDKKLYYSRGIMKKNYVFGVSTFTMSGGTSTTITVPMDGYVRELTGVTISNIDDYVFYGPVLSSYVVNSTSITLTLSKTSTNTFSASVFCSGVNY